MTDAAINRQRVRGNMPAGSFQWLAQRYRAIGEVKIVGQIMKAGRTAMANAMES